MMDFSSLGVTNSRGLWRLVTESFVVNFANTTGRYRGDLMTSLPYIEVVSEGRFSVRELENLWLDRDSIYLLHLNIAVAPAFTEPDSDVFSTVCYQLCSYFKCLDESKRNLRARIIYNTSKASFLITTWPVYAKLLWTQSQLPNWMFGHFGGT
jgi:hypothetical protein